MKRKNMLGLIAIVAIVTAVIFAGCVEESQDKEWLKSSEKNVILVGDDLEKMRKASTNEDYEMWALAAKYLYDDTQYALDESNTYSVSSKYEDAKYEYEKAMNDYKLAGQYSITGIDKIQHGFVEEGNADIKLASNYIESGNNHLQKATDLLKKA
jgi:hypothetical protein